MGAMFFVLIMLCALGFGLFAVLGGIVGILILRRRSPRFKKVLMTILILLLVFGILAMILSAGFFGFIVWVNSVPPEDFVETEIVIEENGYQAAAFTADGVAYQVLELEPNYDVCVGIAEPVFSYKTAGFLNGAQCGNYYALENDHGFDLIWDGGFSLFCPADQAEDVLAYYAGDTPQWYWSVEYGESLLLDAEKSAAIGPIRELEAAAESIAEIPGVRTTLDLYCYSSDGIILMDLFSVDVTEDGAYLLCEVTGTETGSIHTGIPLSDGISAVFRSLVQDG